MDERGMEDKQFVRAGIEIASESGDLTEFVLNMVKALQANPRISVEEAVARGLADTGVTYTMPEIKETDGPIAPNVMRSYGEYLKPRLPKGVGFMLITFRHGEVKGPMYNGYISTGDRVDCVKALKQCVASLESQLN